MKKATHYGECQACGRKQKLPGGTLSKHGYTVERNWGFNGVCHGAGALPFEQDKKVAETALGHAKARLEALTKLAAVTRADRTNVWLTYTGGYPRRSISVQLEVSKVEWISRDITGESYTWVDEARFSVGEEAKRMFLLTYSCSGRSVDEVVGKLNARRADEINYEAVGVERYIEWMSKRLAGWAPKDLTPIAKEGV